MEPNSNSNIQEMLNPDQNQVQEMFQYVRITDSSEFQDGDDNHVTDDSGEEEEEEFSFMSVGADDVSLVAAEDAFMDGQIKPVFPLFDMDLMLSSQDFSMQPHVHKVFVEVAERGTNQMNSSTSGNDEISGPYCDLSNRKVVEVDAESCKKSNSTGFSKIWRFRDFIGRSNSDGRDAFVFFSNGQQEEVVVKEDKPMVSVVRVKAKKATKDKKAASSAHEVYLKRRAKDEERRRPSYLPYRPELMGFFTNVNGGLTRNVHPY